MWNNLMTQADTVKPMHVIALQNVFILQGTL